MTLDPSAALLPLKQQVNRHLHGTTVLSPIEEKVDAIRDVAPILWTMGTIHLAGAIAAWHEVAIRLGVPNSFVDAEIGRLTRQRREALRTLIVRCADPALDEAERQRLQCGQITDIDRAVIRQCPE
jgi:hypothetical protein